MINDIIVGILIVVAAAAGIWCWLFERPAQTGEKGDSEKNIK